MVRARFAAALSAAFLLSGPSVAQLTGVPPVKAPEVTVAKKALSPASTTIAPGGYTESGAPIRSILCVGGGRGENTMAIERAGGVETRRISCAAAAIDDAAATSGARVFFTYPAPPASRGRATGSPRASSAPAVSSGPTIVSGKLALAGAAPKRAPTCEEAFRQFKSGAAAALLAEWEGGFVRCAELSADELSSLGYKAKSLFGYDNRILGFSHLRISTPPDFKGVQFENRAHHNVVWGADYKEAGPLIAFFTAGARSIDGVYLQLFGDSAEPPFRYGSCKKWYDVAGQKGVVYVPVKGKAATSLEVAPVEALLDGVEAPHIFLGSISPKNMASLKSLLGGSSRGWLRVVPTRDGKTPTQAPSLTCSMPPAGWLAIDFGQSPSQKTTASVVSFLAGKKELEDSADAAYEAAFQTFLKNGGGPPVSVAFDTYIPPHYPRWPSAPGVFVANKASFPKAFGMSDEALADAKNWTSAANFKLSGDIPWPNNKRNWTEGCHYAVSGMRQAVVLGPAGPDSILEWATAIASMYAALYEIAKSAAIEIVVAAVTVNECPIQDPVNPAGPQPKGCSEFKSLVRVGVNYAMASVGLPPQLPSMKALVEEGAEYLATQAVDYAIKQAAGPIGADIVDTASDLAREQAIDLVKDQLVVAAQLKNCPYPATSFADAKAKGLGWDPINQCGIARVGSAGPGFFENMGRVAPVAPGDYFTGVIWLKVSPTNFKGPDDAKIQVSVQMQNPGKTPQKPKLVPDSVHQELLKTNGVKLLGSVGTVTVSRRDIRNGVMSIPVVVEGASERATWRNIIERANICKVDAFYEGCLNTQADWIWRQYLEQPGFISVAVAYDWTDDASALQYSGFADGHAVSKSFSAEKIAPQFNVWTPLSKRAGGRKSLPSYQPTCAGFVEVDDQNGLPYLGVTWTKDDLELE